MFIASAASQNINTLAPEPDIPVAQARLVVEDILNAPANRLIPGLMALVLVRQHINTLVPALDIQAGQARLVMVNIQSVHVKVDTLGAAENVLNNHQVQVVQAALLEETIAIVPRRLVMIILYTADLKLDNAVFTDFAITKIVVTEKLIWDVKLDIQLKLHVIMQYLVIRMF